MTTRKRRKLAEITGMALLVIAILLTLALVSHHPTDPSWSVTTTADHSRNLIGRVGAWFSDILFQLLGLGAFVLLIPLFHLAIRLLFKKAFIHLFAHFSGVFLVLVSLSGLGSTWQIRVPAAGNAAPGGLLGTNLATLLIRYFNEGGATIMLVAGFIIGVLLLTSRTLDELRAALFYRVARLFRRKSTASAGSAVTVPRPEVEAPDPPSPMPESRLRPRPDSAPAAPKPAATTASIPISRMEFRDDFSGDETPEGIKNLVTFPSPPLSLLHESHETAKVNETELMEKAGQIIEKLSEFNISGSIAAIHPGPVVTLFEFRPAPGVKYSRILSLVDDLCLGLKAVSIRIDRIPGKSTIGIEVPNNQRQLIPIRSLLESREFQSARSPLTLALGKRINGDAFITDLGVMPHLLVAGATGTGKSVGLNSMITSILYKSNPQQVRFVMIDIKRTELNFYEDIPHLLTPIVTDAKVAANTLIWTVQEMEERYKLLAKYAVRDISQFNKVSADTGETEPLPYVVIVIDEFAELLSVASKEVELCLQRLAQMARAVGIHVLLATQRPSVETITGVIKANFPARISFRLLSRHDSKTILDTVGAEHLLGKGDMLFLPPNSSKLIRIHGCYTDEDETKRLVDFLKKYGEPDYQDLPIPRADDDSEEGVLDPQDDDLYEDVARFIVKYRKASTSVLQRRFRIGYGRAARLMDVLEENGLVGPPNGSRPREVLVPPDFYDQVDSTKDEP
ncbi:MAG: DNA translocase FtsK [Acidobacteria bacterium]|nr:DNA translocase FtsK [Acidobacteriota bacterium]